MQGNAPHRALELYVVGEKHGQLWCDARRRPGRRAWVPAGGFLWARVGLSRDAEVDGGVKRQSTEAGVAMRPAPAQIRAHP